MSTTDEVIPTLREIEAGLRARCTELEQVRNTEAGQREKMRRLITRTAHTQGNDNSIGEALDNLLIELSLPARPHKVTATVAVVHRQPLADASRLRDMSNAPWVTWQNLSRVVVESTTELAVVQEIPREQQSGCACQVPVTDAQMAAILGTKPSDVEVVSLTPRRCTMAEYPWSQGRDEPVRCVTVRAEHEQVRAQAHDDPLVQACSTYPHSAERHFHWQYPNGELAYSVSPDATFDSAVRLPGVYSRNGVAGEPVAEPETVDLTRVQACVIGSHPNHARHVHVRFPNIDPVSIPSYSRDLHYAVQRDEVLLPGVFSRDADVVGGAVTTDSDLDDLLDE